MDKPTSRAGMAQCESEWRDRFARHAVSGQTVVVFCSNESITEGQFYRWRARLREQAGSTRTTVPAPTAFIDAGALKAATANGAASRMNQAPVIQSGAIEVRLDLGQGLMLHIVRH